MKSKLNLPKPNFTEDQEFESSILEDTLKLVSNVFKLTRKVFML